MTNKIQKQINVIEKYDGLMLASSFTLILESSFMSV